jgi:hypothetical protein
VKNEYGILIDIRKSKIGDRQKNKRHISVHLRQILGGDDANIIV